MAAAAMAMEIPASAGSESPVPGLGESPVETNAPIAAGGESESEARTPAGGESESEARTPAGGESESEARTPAGGESESEARTPAGGESESEARTPAGGESESEARTPAGGESESEARTPAGGESESEARTPAGGESESEARTPAGGESESEARTPAGGESESEAPIAAGAEFEKKCIFCKIGNKEESVDLLHWDEQFACFRDIRPGAPHHYLVVPRKHIANCKSLKKEHISVVQKMVNIGKNVLQEKGIDDLADVRLGFHWPPFCTITHLHLHVLAPASQMGFISRLVYRINSYWFITVDQLIEKLKSLPDD